MHCYDGAALLCNPQIHYQFKQSLELYFSKIHLSYHVISY